MRKRIRISISQVAIVFCVLCFAVLCVSMTAKSMESANSAAEEEYFRQQEKQLLQNTRVMLEEQGYGNSGVMITRVVEPEGARRYTITIHHKKIRKLSTDEQKGLIMDLEQLTFLEENCEFEYAFLEMDQETSI